VWPPPNDAPIVLNVKFAIVRIECLLFRTVRMSAIFPGRVRFAALKTLGASPKAAPQRYYIDLLAAWHRLNRGPSLWRLSPRTTRSLRTRSHFVVLTTCGHPDRIWLH